MENVNTVIFQKVLKTRTSGTNVMPGDYLSKLQRNKNTVNLKYFITQKNIQKQTFSVYWYTYVHHLQIINNITYKISDS